MGTCANKDEIQRRKQDGNSKAAKKKQNTRILDNMQNQQNHNDVLKKQIYQFFDKYDTNHDGCLNKEEL